MSIFPKELLDIIFNFSDIKTKRSMKKLCKLTHQSYNFVCNDPIINPYIIKCQVIYKKKLFTSFVYKKDSTNSKRWKIFEVYNDLCKKFNLDKNENVKFNIIWGNKFSRYSILNDNLLLKNKLTDNLAITIPEVIYDGPKRKFKLIYKGKTLGDFYGKKPVQAATKAFQSIVKRNRKENIDTMDSIDFTIQEVTKCSSYKFYYYSGTSKKMANPVIVHIGGRQITYSTENIIKKRKPRYRIFIKN